MWLREHSANPEHYPMLLSDGEWFENFLTAATGGDGLADGAG
jgi:hypothetical protein